MIFGRFTPHFIQEIYENHSKMWDEMYPTNLLSKPIPMFYIKEETQSHKSGDFNLGNWNSGQNLVEIFTRDFVYDRTRSGYLIEEFQCQGSATDDDGLVSHYSLARGVVIAHTDFYDDMWYSSIIVEFNPSEKHDVYLIRHYKSRGCTKSIEKNGHLININEYCELLNILDSLGKHKFRLKSNGVCEYR